MVVGKNQKDRRRMPNQRRRKTPAPVLTANEQQNKQLRNLNQAEGYIRASRRRIEVEIRMDRLGPEARQVVDEIWKEQEIELKDIAELRLKWMEIYFPATPQRLT